MNYLNVEKLPLINHDEGGEERLFFYPAFIERIYLED